MNIKIPVSWLRDYLKTDIAAKSIANYLSLSGHVVEKLIKKEKDTIFEIEITSNRWDTASVYGLAREAHAILSWQDKKTQLVEPAGINLRLEPDTSAALKLDVVVKDKSLCPRL